MRSLRFLLLFIAILSALGAVTARRHEIRLLRQVQAEEKNALRLQQEYRELLLERAQLGGYARIERIARDKFGMVVPVINLPAARVAPANPPANPPAAPAPDAERRVVAAAGEGVF
ncbi:MAG: cell division protein FtsL [Zoogloeaceae bacterium]|jgi:cell division protein FtsL|nr:cell division protein FtsL [Zoogloeaceae bacterium]